MDLELEDDMISMGRWKHEIQTKVSTSGTTSSKKMFQKFSNEVIAMNKRLPKFSNPY